MNKQFEIPDAHATVSFREGIRVNSWVNISQSAADGIVHTVVLTGDEFTKIVGEWVRS